MYTYQSVESDVRKKSTEIQCLNFWLKSYDKVNNPKKNQQLFCSVKRIRKFRVLFYSKGYPVFLQYPLTVQGFFIITPVLKIKPLFTGSGVVSLGKKSFF